MKIFNKILAVLFPQKCLGCKKENEILCPACLGKISRPDTPFLNGVHIAGNYQDLILKKGLWMLKYQGVKQLAKPLAELIQERIWKKLETEDWLIIPVPLSKNKLRCRSYNQAELISGELPGNVRADVLFKKFHTKSQVEVKNKEERLANIIGSFEIRNPEKIAGKKIILIDDVYTTGATMIEAKKILKEAGAKKVVGVVVARG
jgi:competence protein ComFC